MRLILICAGYFALIGCTSIPRCEDTIAYSEDAARIIVFRESRFAGALSSVPMGLDDCLIGKLGNGSYLIQPAPAGRREVALLSEFSGKPVVSLPLEVENGKDYYVRYQFALNVYYGGIVSSSPYLNEVDREAAIVILEKLREIE